LIFGLYLNKMKLLREGGGVVDITIGIEKFCQLLRTSPPTVLRIIRASGLEPSVPGRIGRGGNNLP
jgi:hypothetical protein